VQNGNGQMLLDLMLTLFQTHGWLGERQRQRTDSTHVLGKIRALNRLICIGEAMRFALNSLAVVAPDWLRNHARPDWVDRYGPRIEEARLPSSQVKRQSVAEKIGRDGADLLTSLFDSSAPSFLREIPAVELLRQIWVQNFCVENEALRWRTSEELPPPARFISSPYDQEARRAQKTRSDLDWIQSPSHGSL
jgi:transposase